MEKVQEQEKKEFWLLFGGSAIIYTVAWVFIFLLARPYFLVSTGSSMPAIDTATVYASLATIPWFVYRFISFGKIIFLPKNP